LDYVAVHEGIDPSTIRYSSTGDFDLITGTKEGSFNSGTGEITIGPKGMTNNAGTEFDASNLWETVWHEGQHQQMVKNPNFINDVAQNDFSQFIDQRHRNAQHARIYQKTPDHRYFKYWSQDVKDNAHYFYNEFKRYIRHADEYGY
jgi:hypothetical protein